MSISSTPHTRPALATLEASRGTDPREAFSCAHCAAIEGGDQQTGLAYLERWHRAGAGRACGAGTPLDGIGLACWSVGSNGHDGNPDGPRGYDMQDTPSPPAVPPIYYMSRSWIKIKIANWKKRLTYKPLARKHCVDARKTAGTASRATPGPGAACCIWLLGVHGV